MTSICAVGADTNGGRACRCGLHVHVAAGAVQVVFGADAVRLEAGDSCSCLADAPHPFDNADGNVEALIYLVIEGR